MITVSNEYKLPSKNLLSVLKPVDRTKELEKIKENSLVINETFKSFNIKAKVVDTVIGSAITQYLVKPEAGVSLSRILERKSELTLSLAARSIRIQAPVPGTNFVGIEIPNLEIEAVPFRDISDDAVNSKDMLDVALGKDINGKVVTTRLDKTPHLLVAGATGSGKSVGINVIINSILMKARPDEVKLILVDPKKVEFTFYEGIPHLLKPVVTEPTVAADILREMVDEMEERYRKLASAKVRNIEDYNKKVDSAIADGTDKQLKRLPFIVVIIDELADLMMAAGKDVETSIARIAQKARAAGIHMIIATQRPTVDVVTGLIKANIPSRMSFSVASSVDSKVILDQGGAESLLGRGDMMYLPTGESVATRIQGAYIPDEDVVKIVKHIIAQKWVEPGTEGDDELVVNAEDEENDDLLYDNSQEDEDELLADDSDGIDESVKKGTSGNKKGSSKKRVVAAKPLNAQESMEQGFDSILSEADDGEDMDVEGLYRANNSPRGKAYGKKENTVDLVGSIIHDIISQGVPLLGVEPERDEVFIGIVGGRSYKIGSMVMIVFDIKLGGTNQAYRKVLLQDEPYKVVVYLSPEYEVVMHSIIDTTVQYFEKHYARNSNLMVHNNKYYHGYRVTPFIKAKPDTPTYLEFAYKTLSEQWFETMKDDWAIQVKQAQLEGLVTLTHAKSNLVMKGSKMAVVSDYTYTAKTGSGTLQMTRVLEKLRINNTRYEAQFNSLSGALVVLLNQKYKKGVVDVGKTRLQFVGRLDVPVVWEGIVTYELFEATYRRAELMGLDPQLVGGSTQLFLLTAGEQVIVCGGNGFYLQNTTLGYIRDVDSLQELLQRTKGANLIKTMSVLYDMRRNVNKYVNRQKDKTQKVV